MDVLVIDVGGTHVKVTAPRVDRTDTFESGPALTPADLVAAVLRLARDTTFDAVSIGYPGKVDPNGPVEEPGNLGGGWVGFDFATAFQRPVRVANDAVMQALGAYDGGRMLFLGLGTGLGSAFVAEHVIVPLELGNLPGEQERTLGETVGRNGLEELGLSPWIDAVCRMVTTLRAAFSADYIVLGGGNAGQVDPLPPQTRRGGNHDATVGGIRLWEHMVEPHDRPPALVWRVVA
jgi:polyphosphate glucokinase